MGLLALKLLMSRQRDSKHLGGQIQARRKHPSHVHGVRSRELCIGLICRRSFAGSFHFGKRSYSAFVRSTGSKLDFCVLEFVLFDDRSVPLAAKRKISSCQHSNLQGCKRMAFSGPDLPEDIWRHIHSLLPLRDAARVACVSHAFLRSWKCHPNLTFSRKALGLNGIPHQNVVIARDLTMEVDHILKKHSGKGVKKFRIELYITVDPCYLNSRLQIAAKLRIEELAVVLPSTCNANYYDFPCALFVDDGCRNTIEHLCLGGCAFHPTAGFGNLRRLQPVLVVFLKVVNTPIVPVKFLHLKYLSISLEAEHGAFPPVYDYFSLVSFLDACPVLETFHLAVSQTRMKHDSVFGDPSHLRQRREYRHENIKTVKISGFCSAKSMVELTCHILENAASLECLTLDTIDDVDDIGRHIHETGP
uniref:F-box domain-containing protein n=1 Tax=Aegilops tauschii TaxID=37682 RepID=M8BKI3_AEGTA